MKHLKFFTIIIMFVLNFTFIVYAKESNQKKPEDSQNQNTINYVFIHNNLEQLGIVKDMDLLNKSLELVDEYLQQKPQDPLLQMYKGAFLCILARDSLNVFKKKSYVVEGLKIMDSINPQQYNKNPVLYLKLLMIRGISNSNIPKNFNRSFVAISDLSEAIEYKHFKQVKNDDKVRAYVALSNSYKLQSQTDKSNFYIDKAIQLNKQLTIQLVEK